MTLSICSVHGCPEPTTSGKCKEHQRQAKRESENRRPRAHERGYDSRWRRTRKRYLALHSHCVECGAPATEVDHIDGLGPSGPRGHDYSNLQALCKRHHSQRTAREQPGGWNVGVRPDDGG